MNKIIIPCLAAALAIGGAGCKKTSSDDTTTDNTVSAKVLSNFPTYIALSNLNDLQTKAATFSASTDAFLAAPSQDGLKAMQAQWYATRVSWEQSEGFLFGPVEDFGLDPAIDSWPVNFVDIDSVIANNGSYSDSLIDQLDPTLKGFHPIEYLIFGKDGNRQYTELTQKQKDFLAALVKQLKRVTARMYNEWAPTGNNFSAEVATAGTAASKYSTQREAMLDIVNAMIGIAEEVGGGKIQDPFIAKDPSQEESPFSKNSWNDFKNNITGVKNVYMGGYTTRATGLKDFVQQYNKSLDTKIQQKLDQCISNLAGYTTPFGEAIISQPASIQSTQALLNDLKTTLEDELVPLIKQRVN